MKKFIPILLLVSSVSYADCIEQAANIAFMMKLNGMISNDIENGQEACSSEGAKEEWKEMTSNKYKMMKIIRGELKNKGKTSSQYFGFLSDSTSRPLTENEICKIAEREMEELTGECYPDKSFYQSMLNKNIVGMKLEDICAIMGPQIKIAVKGCRPGQIKDPVKEAPGEEISPANLPGADEKSIEFHKKLKSGSGASRQ